MVTRPIPCASLCLLAAAACGGVDDVASGVARQGLGAGQSVVYVGKQSLTDFTGLGQHLQYWPLFGATSPETGRRTDDPNCIELTPDFASFKHHDLLPDRTFSNDALGVPIGTKTRGGFDNWPSFTLPDGTTGRSGTFYDTSNVDNSNNTVNQMRINTSTLHAFCLNLITDNTAAEHDPDVRLEARSDTVDVSLEGNPDLGFDGQPDMYTFRYEGMQEGDLVKIRMQCSSTSGCQGAGLGGIMVSDISTCADAIADAGPDAAADAGDAEAQDAGSPDAGAAAEDAGVAASTDAGAPDADAPDAEAVGAHDDGADGGGGCTTTRGDGLALALLVSLARPRSRAVSFARGRRRT